MCGTDTLESGLEYLNQTHPTGKVKVTLQVQNDVSHELSDLKLESKKATNSFMCYHLALKSLINIPYGTELHLRRIDDTYGKFNIMTKEYKNLLLKEIIKHS